MNRTPMIEQVPAPTLFPGAVSGSPQLPLLTVEGGVVRSVNEACLALSGPVARGAPVEHLPEPIREMVELALAGSVVGARELRVGSPASFFLASATRLENGALFYAVEITGYRRMQRSLAVQHRVGRVVRDAEAFETAAPEILEAIGSELGWDSGALWTIEGQDLICSARWGDAAPAARLKRGQSLPGRVWDSGQPLWVSDCLEEHDLPRREQMLASGLRTVFGFPIVLQGEVLGVFEFLDRQVREPDPELVQTMATLGSQLGQFIQRRRAQRREHVIAARFQSALLPTGMFTIPGYRAAFSYRPALEEADVGGDFYNLFYLDRNSVCLVIGDVGGKGLESALVAACLQHAIVALMLRPGAAPCAVLDDCQRFLTSLDFEGIVTVFLAILERGTGRLTYCSAGHEPALVYRHASSTVEELPSGQPALVGLSVGPYASRAVSLRPQDVLFVYTDGLSESGTRPEGLLGVEGIANLLQTYARRGPGEILSRMCQTAATLSGHRLRDDIAMAALERLVDEGPEAEPVEWRRCKCHAGGCCCYEPQGPD